MLMNATRKDGIPIPMPTPRLILSDAARPPVVLLAAFAVVVIVGVEG